MLFSIRYGRVFGIIKELVLRRKLFFKDDNGNITVNPLLEAETRWYMSKSFEYTCLSHGLDACEFRAELKSWLYYHSHRSISENTKLAECRNDDEIICMIAMTIWAGTSS
ncbi:hypothetical protein [Salmonella enterica]|uniref:hypothetical protein n=1 Tax=Salmonella enterica TaxID=28901 RepID=UPI002E11028A